MRFYIPGTVTKKEKDQDGEEKSVDGEEAEEQNAASLFYDTLMDKAEIGEVAGDTFATFLDVLHLTPRFVVMPMKQSENWLIFSQRTFRCRYVRKLFPTTRQDLRLQDTIRSHQEIYASTKARRHAHIDYDWSRSAVTAGPNQISFPGNAIQARRRGHNRAQYD